MLRKIDSITRFKEIKAQVIHKLRCKDMFHWTDRLIFGACKCDNQDKIVDNEVEQMQLDNGEKVDYEEVAKFYEK